MGIRQEKRPAGPGVGGDPAASEFPPRRLEPGQRVGHYRIRHRLGAGAMGEVWEARDENLKRIVALKVLPEELAGDRQRLHRLQREAEALAALNHPNIVTVHSVEEVDGLRFITMERIEGERLSDLIPKGGLDLGRIFDIAVPLAGALSAAHERGIIHRDFKSANIMIAKDGRVKVLDFGLAKELEPVRADEASALTTETLTHAAVGTLPYISPEQLDGRPGEARSDLFALGVVLYEMATGKRPFRGDSSAKVITSILRDEPAGADHVRQDLPHHLGRIIRLCLVKDPEHRYQAAKDVRNELEALRDELEEVQRSTQPVPRPPSLLRMMVAVLAVALAGTGIYVLWQQATTDKNPSRPAAAAEKRDSKRIVVLPFENLGQAENEYFADGMTEEIVSRLTGVEGIGVISHISAMQYKGTGPSLETLAADLDVDYVLAGKVRRERDGEGQDRIRITPHLTRVADKSLLWSGRYDSGSTDVLDMQSRIAEQVIHELQVAISEPMRAALRTRATDDPAAYDAYLRGLEFNRYPTYSEERAALAEQMFKRAVDLDPGFALAYAELAGVHSLIYFNTDGTEARLAAASSSIERALELAPQQPAVHLAAANYYYRARLDYERALEEYSIALAGLPGSAEVLAGIGFVRRRMGEWDLALEMLREAFELDPRSARLAISLADTLRATRDYEGAAPFIDKAIGLAPDQAEFWGAKADNVFESSGDIAAARRILDGVPVPNDPLLLTFESRFDLYVGDYAALISRLTPEKIAPLGVLDGAELHLRAAFAHRKMGAHQQARELLESSRNELVSALTRTPKDPILHGVLARTFAMLGRREEALEHGQKAVALLPNDAYSGPGLLESLAETHALLGDVEEAVALLRQLRSTSYRQPVGVPHLKLDPVWESLRDTAEFQKLLEWHGTSMPAAPAGDATKERGRYP